MKCPECGEEITSLISVFGDLQACWVTLNGDGELDYDSIDDYELNQDEEFRCSHCNELITTDYDEAKRILGGK